MDGRAEAVDDKKKNKNAWALVTPAWTAAYLLFLSGCDANYSLEPTIEYATEAKLAAADLVIKRVLPPGIYVVEVRERDIDIRLNIDVVSSTVVLEDDVRRHGLLTTVVRLDAPAAVRIRLQNGDEPTKSGSADVAILRLPSVSTETPSDFEKGYAAFSAAEQQIARATPAARKIAVGHMQDAIARFAAAGDVAAVAQAQYSLAYLQYRTLNEWSDSLRMADEARRSYALLRDATGVANALTLRSSSELEFANILDATTHRDEQMRMFTHADQTLVETARYFRERGMRVREAFAVNMRGVGDYYRADMAAAVQEFSTAAGLARAGHDDIEELRSRGNLAAARLALGYPVEAASEYQRVLELIDRDRNPYQYATAKLNYGWCLVDLGEIDRAIAVFTEALKIYTDLGQPQERAVALSALGRTYLQMGDAARALPALLDAAEESRRTNDMQGVAGALHVAGDAAAALGRHEEALALLRRAFDGTLGDSYQSRIRVQIARELRALGKIHEAASQLELTLEGDSNWGRAKALEERGLLQLERGNLQSGIADLQDADRRFAKCGTELNRIGTQTELSTALLRTGDVSGAAKAADAAISLEELIRLKSGNSDWRARFLSTRYAPYEARIAAYFAAKDQSETDRSWHGFRVAERVRARSLSDRVAGSSGFAARPRDPRGDELREQLATLYSTLERSMRSSRQDPDGAIRLRTRIEESRAQLEKHLGEHRAIAATAPSVPDSLADAQAMVPPSTAILAFFVGDETTHVWVLSHGSLRHRVAPGGADLERQVAEFLVALRTERPRNSGSKLSHALLDGLLDGVSESRLMVLADGPLNGLPFAVLPLPGGKPGEQLLDRFVIAMAPSLQLAVRAGYDVAQGNDARAAIVSDPVFTANDRRLLAGRERSTGVLRDSRSLARLPFSAIEARAVRNAFDPATTIELAGFQANASRVLALGTQHLRVLHFATHAESRSDSPDLSALYLSKYTPDGRPIGKDRLTADDIMNNGLRADLVVLSGCATGAGDELRGEGVLGLTYGFLANGSGAVIASLWQIEDAPTAQFMEEFYIAFRKTGRAADALRLAQLESRRELGSPVWSSFVVRANAFP